MNAQKKRKAADQLTIALLLVYLIVLCWILILKLGVRFSYMENRLVNLVPFRQLFTSNGKADFGELVMNVVIFVPLGVYTGVLFQKRVFIKHLSFFFLVSLIIEGLQYVLRIGSFDITDTITNTLGGIIGLMLYKAIETLSGNGSRAQKFINMMALAGTVLMLLFLYLLKTNHLGIRYQ